MTKRVIQTDLFAAFKESQQQAEEQYGQKRKIHVEGNNLRKIAEISTSTANSGYEVIMSKNDSATTAIISETVTKIKAIDDTATVETAIEATPQLAIVKEEVAEVTQVISEPETSNVEEIVNEQVIEEPKAPEVKKVDNTVVRKVVDSNTPVRRRVVTRKVEPVSEPIKKTASPVAKVKSNKDTERITIPSVVRAPIKKKPVQEEKVEKAPKEVVNTSSNSSGLFMKIAAVLTAVAAAYAFYTQEPETTTNEVVIKKVKGLVDNGAKIKAADKVLPAPYEDVKDIPKEIKKEAKQESSVRDFDPIIPVVTGGYSILLCSGIDRRSARNLSNFVKSQSAVQKNNWEVFEHNTAVYVGRFEDGHDPMVKICEKFCQNLVYEGSKQFSGALFFPLPERIKKGSK